MIRKIRLGISLLDENDVPTRTVPVCVMNWNEEAVKEVQEKFNLDLREEAHVVLVTEVVRNLHKVLPKLLFVDALDEAGEEVFQNTVRGGEPDQRVGEALDSRGVHVISDGITNTPEDVEMTVSGGPMKYVDIPVIPDDADQVHAEWQSGERGGLCVSWYAEPKMTPEWYGKNLGFCVRLDLEDGWGQRLAKLINELWERVEEKAQGGD